MSFFAKPFELDAKRIENLDFFYGITSPFGDAFASLIIGGWGGCSKN